MRTTMRRAVIVVSLMVAFATYAGVKYGSPSDLRGAATFFVDTDGEVRTHDDLVSRIESKTALKSVDDAEHADVIVIWTTLDHHCANAKVMRTVGEDVKAVWNWKDCASGWVSPEFLFVRKFANVVAENR